MFTTSTATSVDIVPALHHNTTTYQAMYINGKLEKLCVKSGIKQFLWCIVVQSFLKANVVPSLPPIVSGTPSCWSVLYLQQINLMLLVFIEIKTFYREECNHSTVLCDWNFNTVHTVLVITCLTYYFFSSETLSSISTNLVQSFIDK